MALLAARRPIIAIAEVIQQGLRGDCCLDCSTSSGSAGSEPIAGCQLKHAHIEAAGEVLVVGSRSVGADL
jgi:hypothetical protein